MVFEDFEWDAANIEHITEHRVTPDEVEEACVGDSYTRKTGEGRYLVYGTTDNGRYHFIVGINKGRGVYRTITARDMTDREKALHKRRCAV